MKILYLAHRIPYPPNKGEKTRCFHQLQYLAAQHSIDLFCFADNAKEAEGKEGLAQVCRNVYVEVLPARTGFARAAAFAWKKLPLSILYYQSRTMQRAVLDALGRECYDLIFVYCSSMAQFVPQPAPAISLIDFVDADSAKWRQYAARTVFPKSWFYSREGSLLARYEKRVAANFDVSIVATRQEALELGGGECSAVEVVENGVALPPAEALQGVGEDIRKMQPYLLFVGTMNYRPNVDAVCYFSQEIFPLLRRTHPSLRFLIVGRDPTMQVQKLGQLPGIIVTGAVPDVQEYIDGAAVAVAPFRIAQGVQNKVLEALVSGLPVVLTSRPARAIGDIASDLLRVADTPEDFAGAVRFVLDNPEVRTHAQAAAPLLRESLGWETRLRRLGLVIDASASKHVRERQGVLPEVVVGQSD